MLTINTTSITLKKREKQHILEEMWM